MFSQMKAVGAKKHQYRSISIPGGRHVSLHGDGRVDREVRAGFDSDQSDFISSIDDKAVQDFLQGDAIGGSWGGSFSRESGHRRVYSNFQRIGAAEGSYQTLEVDSRKGQVSLTTSPAADPNLSSHSIIADIDEHGAIMPGTCREQLYVQFQFEDPDYLMVDGQRAPQANLIV